MEATVVDTSAKPLPVPQSKNTGLTHAECLRMAVGLSGNVLTILGCSSLAYGLSSSSTAFCIAGGALGLPGVAMLVGTCASYCCDQAEHDENIALIPHPSEKIPTIPMDGNSPTFISPTFENPRHAATLQDWFASQAQVEENLRRKSLPVSATTDSNGGTGPQADDMTAIAFDPQKSARRQTAHNPRKSSRNPRVRSGEQEIVRNSACRTRASSEASTRNSLNVENNTIPEDETNKLEQEYEMLMQKYHDSLSSFESDSESDS